MATGQQNDFINMVGTLALKYAPSYNVKVVSPIIAQAIIESNWGQSGLTQRSNNLFGIKCGSSWKGRAVNMSTKEEYTVGTLTTVKSDFRAYDSIEDSIHDYFEFTNTKRYAALKDCTTPLAYCEAIKAAGYATSSTYVDTLMKCINNYGLTSFDTITEIPVTEVTKPEPKPEIPIQHITSVVDYGKIVTEVINGLHGNGNDRVISLAEIGYDPTAVQYMVNLQIKINELTKENEKCYNIINKVKEAIK